MMLVTKHYVMYLIVGIVVDILKTTQATEFRGKISRILANACTTIHST